LIMSLHCGIKLGNECTPRFSNLPPSQGVLIYSHYFFRADVSFVWRRPCPWCIIAHTGRVLICICS
jgi:hypothetical protein